MAAATITIPTRWCAVATASCPSTFTCPDAHRRRKRCSTVCCCCRRRSGVPEPSNAKGFGMDDGRLDALGQKSVGALPGAAAGHSDGFGQLALDVQAGKIVDVVTFLRGDPGCRFVNFTDIPAVD